MPSYNESQERPQPQGLYKVTIHAKRREGMSEADFHRHWTDIHAPKVSHWLRKHGIVGYTQYHTPSWVRAEAGEKLKTLGGFATQNAAEFDGYVELRMPDMGCYERARKGECAVLLVGLRDGAKAELKCADLLRSVLCRGCEAR